jgi:hypothetical protein
VIGLKNPITVLPHSGRPSSYVLSAGMHRLAAAKRLSVRVRTHVALAREDRARHGCASIAKLTSLLKKTRGSPCARCLPIRLRGDLH